MSSIPRVGGRHPWGWVAIVATSVLIHVVALDALPRWTIEPAEQNAYDRPLRAILLPPLSAREEAKPPSPDARSAGAAAQPPRASRPVSRFPRIPTHIPAPVPEFIPESLDETIPRVDVSPYRGASPQKPAPHAAGGASGTQIANPDTPEQSLAPPMPDALAPASARLDYKVVAVERKKADPVSYYGVGSIAWANADGRYRGDLKAAVDFLLFKVNVLVSHSEGAVTGAGLAPDRYTETPRKRSTVATSFNRDARQSISFSASPATVALMPGAQDRLSVLFQIGALLRASPRLATTGGRIDIPVAGVRGDVETWAFESLGVETIGVGPGPLSTAHLRRMAKPGSNDKTIDIWIAYADGGYPARVLYTEPDGSTIEMTLERIESE